MITALEQKTVLAHLMQMRPENTLDALWESLKSREIQLLVALSGVLHVCNLLHHVEEEECLQPVSPTWQDAVQD